MSYQLEFPFLYEVTKMDSNLIRAVGENLTYYSVDVRIDYERWVQYCDEFEDWSKDISISRLFRQQD
jgi:hypothetical protein